MRFEEVCSSALFILYSLRILSLIGFFPSSDCYLDEKDYSITKLQRSDAKLNLIQFKLIIPHKGDFLNSCSNSTKLWNQIYVLLA